MSALARARAHLRELWPHGAIWPVAPFILYAVYSALRHDLRIEHVLVLVAVAAFAYVGPRSKELLLGLYPFALVGLLYDGMRAYQTVGLTPERVRLCDLRALESTLFGYTSGGVPKTVHDYFVVHHTTALDLFCAFPYATFIVWCMAGSIYLYVKDRPAMKRFAWGFLLLNVAAFITYHLIPAAPPWYFHSHGCVVDLSTRASEGPALARVDALLGIGYFAGMYSKASSVFGALPSLHCGYPLLIALEGYRAFGRKLRVMSFAYWLAMVFSAVYLDHHWVIDTMMGSAYAAAISGGLRLTRLGARVADSGGSTAPRVEATS